MGKEIRMKETRDRDVTKQKINRRRGKNNKVTKKRKRQRGKGMVDREKDE